MQRSQPVVTPKRRHRLRNFFLALFILLGAVVLLTAIMNLRVKKKEMDFIASLPRVTYTQEAALQPVLDENGRYRFTADRAFKILQLTDIHIGGGYLCADKDLLALDAVAAMIRAEEPDLVVFTGDMAYPVPFQAGTLNNRTSADILASLMEQLGVYWCCIYGNHDTEAYSYYNREQISRLVYGNREKYTYSLFQSGPEETDGEGNYIILLENTAGEITQSFVMLDSHAYLPDDPLGAKWHYDAIHENQIDWYEASMQALTAENNGKTPPSLAFFHIAPNELNEAFRLYKEAGYQDTEQVKYKYGALNETNEVICSSQLNYGIVDALMRNGTQGVFFGHDHLNNLSLNYRGLQLTYGFSVDFLAYNDIAAYGRQRGCTVITVAPDGSFDNYGENYYQDKYVAALGKAPVILERDMKEDFDVAGSLAALFGRDKKHNRLKKERKHEEEVKACFWKLS